MLFADTEIGSVLLNILHKEEFPKPFMSPRAEATQ